MTRTSSHSHSVNKATSLTTKYFLTQTPFPKRSCCRKMTLFDEEVMDRTSVAPEPGFCWTGHHQGTVSDTEDGGLRPEARVLHSEVSRARDPIDLAASVAEEEACRRRVAASTESAHTLAQGALKGVGDASEKQRSGASWRRPPSAAPLPPSRSGSEKMSMPRRRAPPRRPARPL